MRARLFWPLTARGTGALVLAVAAFVLADRVGVPELVYVGVLLVIAVTVGWASLWTVHRYGAASRSFSPDVAAVGHESVVSVRATARAGLAGGVGRWRDLLPSGVEGAADGVFGAVAAFDGMRVDYRLRATRRGIREIGPFTVTVSDPFGFARRRVRLGGVDTMTVTPAIVPLAPLREFPGEAGGSLHTATHQLGEGADNLIPRAYLPGDSMRRVNWRASAHHNQLMVRQEEQESTPEATVVLDRAEKRWAPSAASEPGADAAFEAALTAALSAAARLVREGYDVVVADTDGMPLAPAVPAGDAAGLEHLAMELATVVAVPDDHLALVPRLFAGTVAGPVVVVTGRLSPDDADALAGVVPHSALPVLIAVDPHPGALARADAAGWRSAALSPGGDLDEAWRTATDRGASRAAG